jgi:bacteriochlorophyll 4-vinyl reductase
MRESGVGRVLVASLHQAIGDLAPTRLGFYENWLNAEGLRDGTIGLAPLYAVLSFLRQEDDHLYDAVTIRAGAYAAEWTVAAMRPLNRRLVSRLPLFLRRRVVLRRATALVSQSYAGSRGSWRIRRGVARVDVRASVFCAVREPVAAPLCGYYASATQRLLGLFDIEASVTIASCRAVGAATCGLTAPLTATEPVPVEGA